MASALLCPLAYRRDGPRKPIICKVSGIVCAHQFWCDISVEFKHHPEAKTCPGQEENHGKETGQVNTDQI